MPVVGAIEGRPTGVVLIDGVVVKHYTVDGLVEDVLTGDGNREGNGKCPVECDGRFPDLRHLEVVIDACNFTGCGSSLRSDGLGIFVGIDLIEGIEDLPTVGDEFSTGHHRCKGSSIGNLGCTALHDTCVCRHIGEEHKRDTACE